MGPGAEPRGGAGGGGRAGCGGPGRHEGAVLGRACAWPPVCTLPSLWLSPTAEADTSTLGRRASGAARMAAWRGRGGAGGRAVLGLDSARGCCGGELFLLWPWRPLRPALAGCVCVASRALCVSLCVGFTTTALVASTREALMLRLRSSLQLGAMRGKGRGGGGGGREEGQTGRLCAAAASLPLALAGPLAPVPLTRCPAECQCLAKLLYVVCPSHSGADLRCPLVASPRGDGLAGQVDHRRGALHAPAPLRRPEELQPRVAKLGASRGSAASEHAHLAGAS